MGFYSSHSLNRFICIKEGTEEREGTGRERTNEGEMEGGREDGKSTPFKPDSEELV